MMCIFEIFISTFASCLNAVKTEPTFLNYAIFAYLIFLTLYLANLATFLIYYIYVESKYFYNKLKTR